MIRVPIRTKLLAALVVPLTMIAVVAVIEVGRANDDRDTALRRQSETSVQADVASAAAGPASVLDGLINARAYQVAYSVGVESSLNYGPYVGATGPEFFDRKVDDSLVVLEATLGNAPQAVVDTYGPALATIKEQLPAIRALPSGIAAGARNPSQENLVIANSVADGYNAVVRTLLDAGSRLSFSVNDPELRNGIELLSLANRRIDAEARTILNVGTASGVFSDSAAGRTRLLSSFVELGTLLDSVNLQATGTYLTAAPAPLGPKTASLVENTLAGNINTAALLINGIIEANRENEPTRHATSDAAAALIGERAETLKDTANTDADDAESKAELVQLLSILGALGAVVVAVFASRSITRPLRTLTGQAEEMATVRLPEAVRDILEAPAGQDVVMPELIPITVHTRDEVREVAAALNLVQERAITLAVEQAALRRNIADAFVNLGRRNQNLIGRQLDFISELERNEANPQSLEHLFKLDHLATRMRRNAESLVVLAGLESPRQWSSPVEVADVVRAAMSKVEGFERVNHHLQGPAAIAGSAAPDLAHLLAELIENALAFSSPESTVEVFGRLGPNGYVLSVVDEGIGMNPAQLAESSRRLAGTESFTVAPSRYLGHYVAGRLALRLGVTIELTHAPSGGLAARVSVPTALLEVHAEPEVAEAGTAPEDSDAPAEADAETEADSEAPTMALDEPSTV